MAVRERSVITGYGRKWTQRQEQTGSISPQLPQTASNRDTDRLLLLKTLVAEARLDIDALREAVRSKRDYSGSLAIDLQSKIESLRSNLELERRHHEMEGARWKELTVKGDTGREFEKTIEMQRKTLQQKDLEIRNLSELAAAQKEQIAMLSLLLKPGLENIAPEVLHINKESLLTALPPSTAFIPDTIPDSRHWQNTEELGITEIEAPYFGSRYAREASLEERLDAADGVMDGKYFGQRIVSSSNTKYPPMTAAERLDAADGVMDGKYFGQRIVSASNTKYPPMTAAERLDAADGVMDGTYFGRRIIAEKMPVQENNRLQKRVITTEDLRSYPLMKPEDKLDAADGIIDGKYYGRNIVGSSVYDKRSLRELDAEDGVVDGKYFGRPIVGMQSQESIYRQNESPGSPAFKNKYLTPEERLDAADGVIDGMYFGKRIVGTSQDSRRVLTQEERLDAADGVIDGMHYGQSIRKTPQQAYESLEDRLDAADGVLDGKYYGQRIVGSSRDFANTDYHEDQSIASEDYEY